MSKKPPKQGRPKSGKPLRHIISFRIDDHEITAARKAQLAFPVRMALSSLARHYFLEKLKSEGVLNAEIDEACREK